MTKMRHDELKLISDDKNYDEMYAASSLTRRDGTKMLFEDYRTFKIHPIGSVRPIPWTLGEPTILFYFFYNGGWEGGSCACACFKRGLHLIHYNDT